MAATISQSAVATPSRSTTPENTAAVITSVTERDGYVTIDWTLDPGETTNEILVNTRPWESAPTGAVATVAPATGGLKASSTSWSSYQAGASRLWNGTWYAEVTVKNPDSAPLFYDSKWVRFVVSDGPRSNPQTNWVTSRTVAAQQLAGRVSSIASVTCLPDKTSASALTGSSLLWQRFWCTGEMKSGRVFRVLYATTGQCVSCWTFSHLTYVQPKPSRTPHVGGTTYITTGGIEEAIEQNGLTVSGIRHATLYVACEGQGVPGANRIDPKFGVSEPSYAQFACTITLSGSSVNFIHIQMGHEDYTWQVIG
jgi:hypothetical protein